MRPELFWGKKPLQTFPQKAGVPVLKGGKHGGQQEPKAQVPFLTGPSLAV